MAAKGLGEHFLSDKDRQLIVPVDHGLSLGNVKGLENPDSVLRELVRIGIDGTLASPGVARRVGSLCREAGIGLILTLDTQVWARAEQGEDYVRDIALISSVEQAQRLGVDAVKILLVQGSPDPRVYMDNIEMMAEVVEAADALRLPVMVEPVWFGAKLDPQAYEDAIWHGSRIAMEVGAHILKIPVLSPKVTEKITGWGLPVYFLGGALSDDQSGLLQQVRDGLKAGVRGVVFGRNVWQSASMSDAVRRLRDALG